MEALYMLCLAVVVKVSLFLISSFVVARRGKKNAPVSINYVVAQSGSKSQDKQRSKVVITGGSGHLGAKIVEQLVEKHGDQLQITVFDAAAVSNKSCPQVTYVKGDIRNPTHVSLALSGAKCVIHSAALLQHAESDFQEMSDVNVRGTRNLLEACLEKDVKYLIYTSSVSVVAGPRGSGPIKEDAAYPAKHPLHYSHTKAEAERLVLAANSHLLRTVSLRPGGMYGVGDKVTADLALARKPGVDLGDQRVPLVWVEDAARAHVQALGQFLFPQPGSTTPAIAGKALHLCHDPQDLPSLNQFMGHTAENEDGSSIWGLPPAPMMPLWLVMLLARFNDMCVRVLKKAVLSRGLYAAMLEYVLCEGVYDITQARKLLGWEPAGWREAVKRVRQDAQQDKKSK